MREGGRECEGGREVVRGRGVVLCSTLSLSLPPSLSHPLPPPPSLSQFCSKEGGANVTREGVS